MEAKAKIFLFTSMTCPHCPAAKREFDKVLAERDDIKGESLMVHEPRAQQLGKRFGVQSVPTFIIIGPGHDGPIGLVGSHSTKILNKYINKAIGKEKKQEEPNENKERKPFLKRIFG